MLSDPCCRVWVPAVLAARPTDPRTEATMTRSVEVTREQLLDRRAELLAGADTTLADFMDRTRRSEIVGSEWELLDELEKIAFLLGED